VVAVAIAFMLLLVLVAGLALARAGGDIARTPDVAPVRVGE
jgi:hypothetical protein